MFETGRPRKITSEVRDKLSNTAIHVLWMLIDEMEVEEKDYIQFFEITCSDDEKTVRIRHSQQQPEYEKMYEHEKTNMDGSFIGTIVVVDDGMRQVMMLAEKDDSKFQNQ